MGIDWQTVLLSIGGGIGTTVAGAGGFYLKWRGMRREEREKDRLTRAQEKKDALDEYKALVVHLEEKVKRLNEELDEEDKRYRADREELEKKYQAQIEQLTQKSNTQIQTLETKLDLLSRQSESEVRRLQDERQRILLEASQLRGELRLLQVNLSQLRGGMPSLGVAESWVDAIIIADENGIIQSANPAVEFLTHWKPEELLGKNLTTLMPREFVAGHNAGLAKFRETHRIPLCSKMYQVRVRTREGDEIPTDVQLTAWQAGGKWLVGGAMRRRFDPISAMSSVELVEEVELMKRAQLLASETGVAAEELTKGLEEGAKPAAS